MGKRDRLIILVCSAGAGGVGEAEQCGAEQRAGRWTATPRSQQRSRRRSSGSRRAPAPPAPRRAWRRRRGGLQRPRTQRRRRGWRRLNLTQGRPAGFRCSWTPFRCYEDGSPGLRALPGSRVCHAVSAAAGAGVGADGAVHRLIELERWVDGSMPPWRGAGNRAGGALSRSHV